MPALEDRVQTRIRRWLERGLSRRWLVAVSGGSDSVALLRLLAKAAEELDLTLAVASLDHGVRGAESAADQEFVADLAARLGLPCRLGRYSPESGGNFEAQARQYRYQFLTRTAGELGARVIATGHTRDDQVETILQRICRGTGIRGLAGMPALRILNRQPQMLLVRPLLRISRDELKAYLHRQGQPYCTDRTNRDESRTRARIRYSLRPALADQFNPRIDEAIARLGALATAQTRSLDRTTAQLAAGSIAQANAAQIVLERQRISRLPLYLRGEVLREVWRKQNWPQQAMAARHWLSLARLCQQTADQQQDLAGSVRATVRGPYLILERQPRPTETVPPEAAATDTPGSPVPLEIPGEAPLLQIGCVIRVFRGASPTTQPAPAPLSWSSRFLRERLQLAQPALETIDADKVFPPLLLDYARHGDRFQPLGMKGNSMKLSAFLRGRGISRHARPAVPVVRDQQGIVWVVGQRISHRVRVTDQTITRLQLECLPLATP